MTEGEWIALAAMLVCFGLAVLGFGLSVFVP